MKLGFSQTILEDQKKPTNIYIWESELVNFGHFCFKYDTTL